MTDTLLHLALMAQAAAAVGAALGLALGPGIQRLLRRGRRAGTI